MKSIWKDMNTRLEKTEALNKKLLDEIMDNRHQSAKAKLMKYEVVYLVLSILCSTLTPLYYFAGVFSVTACIMFFSLFFLSALWQVYKIQLLKKMEMDAHSTTELLQKAIKFKVITRLRTVVGLILMIPFLTAFMLLSPGLMKPEILVAMGVGVVVGLVIGLSDYFKNQKDIDKLIKCYKDSLESNI